MRDVEIATMRLHFQAQGDGHPLIILHGLLGSLDNWRTMTKRLAQQFWVYAVDLRNHGQSPHSETMNYPVMARDIRELIASEGLAPAHVLGHSMGGKVGMRLALDFPELIAKLVVVDIAPKAYPPTHRPILSALRALDLAACDTFTEAGVALADAIPDSALRDFLLKNLTRNSSRALEWRIGLDEIIGNYEALTHEIAIDAAFENPACFIRSGRSDFILNDDFSTIHSAFPRARIMTIADAGHWLHIEAADEFERVVSRFLTEG